MPSEGRTCCRWTVTFLHVVICLVSGACILTVLLLRETNHHSDYCLPPFIGNTGHKVYFNKLLDSFCDVMLYSAGVISGWSILSLFVHCCWENKLCFGLQTAIFIMVSILCLIGSSSLTTQFLLWCNDLKTMCPDKSATCRQAATSYDDLFGENKHNMSVYYTTDIIQQSCTWSLAIMAILMSFIYISLMCVSPVTSHHNTIRGVIHVRDDEQRPLLSVEDPPPYMEGDQ